MNNGILSSEDNDNNLGTNIQVNVYGKLGAYNGRRNSSTVHLVGGSLTTIGGTMSTWDGPIYLDLDSVVNLTSGLAGYNSGEA